MRRRDLLTALAGALVLPFAAHGQQAMPIVGFLRSTSLAPFATPCVALREGLKEAGFVEGQSVAIADVARDRRRGDRMNSRVMRTP
jgi:putative ABC transport system substrate-binding protein